MKITITINTENAAFENNLDAEVTRILRQLSAFRNIANWPVHTRGINGNNVGDIIISDDEEGGL